MNARQSKKNLKNSILRLDNGTLLKRDCIIRMTKRAALPEYDKGPAIILDYRFGDRGNTEVVEFENENDRDGAFGEYTYLLGWR